MLNDKNGGTKADRRDPVGFQPARLDIDCFEIALVQNTEAEAISFRGPGYIRQGEDDRIGFKIYAVERINTDLPRDLNRIARQTAGTL